MKQRLLSLRLPETTMHSILRKPQQSPTGLPPGNPRPPNQVTSDCTASLSRPRNGSPRPRTKHTAPAGAFVAMVILRLLICSDTVLQSERTRSSSPNSPVGLRTRHWLCQQSSSPSIPAPPRPPFPGHRSCSCSLSGVSVSTPFPECGTTSPRPRPAPWACAHFPHSPECCLSACLCC